MYDASQPLRLNDDNPYSGGELLVRDDDTAELHVVLPDYQPGPGDRFHPALLPGQMLDQVAWEYWQDEVENAERWWWVLASVNNIDNPLDLTEHVGRRLLIPDLARYRLLANAQN
jgi:hypothetical protein